MIEERKIYLSKCIKIDEDDEGNPYKIYGEPQPFDCVLNSLSGSTDITAFGDRIKNMAKTLLDYEEWIGRIHEGDKVYLYGATPTNEKVHGENANLSLIHI